MRRFQAGFEQGVAYVDQDIEVSSLYLSPNFDGFISSTLGWLGAHVLIDEGADVLWAAAGDSGLGMFEAVYVHSEETGRQVWSMGVDVDEVLKLEELKDEPGMVDAHIDGWKAHILTSIVKRLDGAVFQAIDNYVTTGAVGAVEMTIANGGLDYVPTPHLEDLSTVLDELRRDLASGAVVIDGDMPTVVRYLEDALLG